MSARLRRSLHILAADLLYYSGLLRLWRFLGRSSPPRQEICVLGLHRVLSEEERRNAHSLDAIVLREATFVKMLEYLRQHFRVVPLNAVLENPPAEKRDARPSCVLTFDDGWRDNYTTAYPWLKKFGLPATIFLVTGMIGDRGGFWVERLLSACRNADRERQIREKLARQPGAPGADAALDEVIEHLKRMPAEARERLLGELLPAQPGYQNGDQMMTWEQAREMSRDGVEFGGHTVTHPLLPYEPNVLVERELHDCKEAIESTLGIKVRAFAYPNGDWDERIRGLVAASGYQCAFTTQGGWHQPGQNRHTIRRILLHEGNVTGHNGEFSPAMFQLTLAGWH